MRTLQQWFDEYAVSHQHTTNKKIHYICVPSIFFSIVGLFMCIPSSVLSFLYFPILSNWAFVALLAVLIFYWRLSFNMFVKMAIFSALCLVGSYFLGQSVPLLQVSIGIFVVAWIGQFYGHKLEGKKPSFLEDIQFLLIGPAWVIDNIGSGR